LLATSPGKRGGKTLLDLAVSDFPHRAGRVCSHFVLPSYYATFDNGITDHALKMKFKEAAKAFQRELPSLTN
jgi:hypothetical protein